MGSGRSRLVLARRLARHAVRVGAAQSPRSIARICWRWRSARCWCAAANASRFLGDGHAPADRPRAAAPHRACARSRSAPDDRSAAARRASEQERAIRLAQRFSFAAGRHRERHAAHCAHWASRAISSTSSIRRKRIFRSPAARALNPSRGSESEIFGRAETVHGATAPASARTAKRSRCSRAASAGAISRTAPTSAPETALVALYADLGGEQRDANGIGMIRTALASRAFLHARREVARATRSRVTEGVWSVEDYPSPLQSPPPPLRGSPPPRRGGK